MILRKMAFAASALALVSAPIAATAAEAERTAAPAKESSEAVGSGVLAALAVVLIGAGIYFAVDGDDDEPASV